MRKLDEIAGRVSEIVEIDPRGTEITERVIAVEVPVDDYNWLIARIRALDAQETCRHCRPSSRDVGPTWKG